MDVMSPSNYLAGNCKGAFHYAKDLGNFGRKSNGKVRFGSVGLEYSGPQRWSVDPVAPIFAVPFSFDKPSCREFGKGIKMVKAIPLGWPGLIGKCRSIFPRVFPLVSVRHNETNPRIWHRAELEVLSLTVSETWMKRDLFDVTILESFGN